MLNRWRSVLREIGQVHRPDSRHSFYVGMHATLFSWMMDQEHSGENTEGTLVEVECQSSELWIFRQGGDLLNIGCKSTTYRSINGRPPNYLCLIVEGCRRKPLYTGVRLSCNCVVAVRCEGMGEVEYGRAGVCVCDPWVQHFPFLITTCKSWS